MKTTTTPTIPLTTIGADPQADLVAAAPDASGSDQGFLAAANQNALPGMTGKSHAASAPAAQADDAAPAATDVVAAAPADPTATAATAADLPAIATAAALSTPAETPADMADPAPARNLAGADESAPAAPAAGGELASPLPTFTLNQIGDYLKMGFWDWWGSYYRSFNVDNSTGTGYNARTLYYNYTGFSGISGAGTDTDGLSAARQALVDDALDYIGELLGITFIQTASQDTSVDIFFKDNDSGAYSNSTLFGSGDGSANHRYIDYSWVNVATTWSGGTSDINDYTYQTFIHEIGHAIGLGHGGPYNGTVNYITDTTQATTNNNSYLNDCWQHAIMSYIDQTTNTTINADYNFVITYMAGDFEALRDYYGSTSAFNGNTVYGFNTNISTLVSETMANLATWADETAFAIIDSDGIDTVDFSGYAANQKINLTIASGGSTTGTISDIGGQIGNMALGVGTVIENAIGGSGNDTITGNTADNSLVGGAGNDSIYASTGNDTVDGGTGADTLNGYDGNDLYIVDNVGDVISGEFDDSLGGIDTVQSSVTYTLVNAMEHLTLTGSATIDGTGNYHDNTLTGNGASNVLYGLDGNDSISGGGSMDTLYGGNGNDTLVGGSMTDAVYGEAGNDTVVFTVGHFFDNVDGGADTDTLDTTALSTSGYIYDFEAGTVTGYGGAVTTVANIEIFQGGSGDDTVISDGNSHTYYGNDGNDMMIAEIGGETMDGGAGTDTIDLSRWNGTYTVDMATGASSWGGELYTNFENLISGNGADNITGTSGANVITTNGGDDTINAGGGADTVNAGGGNDRVVDTDFVNFDVHDGGDGIDWIDYSGVSFSSGIVHINLGAGTVTVTTSGGNTETISNFENVDGSQGGESITGSAGDNILNGNGGNDTLYGGNGNDTLDGGTGADNMNGGDHSDLYYVDDAGDVTAESFNDSLGGVDTVMASATHTIGYGIEHLTLTGAAAINGTGNENANIITGNAANNVLSGLAGNDSISGGGGIDTVYGGDGDDVITDTNSGTGDVFDGGAGTDTLVADFTWSNNVQYNLAAGWMKWPGAGGTTYDTILNIENLTVGGGADVEGDANANLITVTDTGFTHDNVINTQGGNDTVYAGIGNDSIDGGYGMNSIHAGDGDDTLTSMVAVGSGGHANDNVFDGGAGVDTLVHDLSWVSTVTFDLASGWTYWDGTAYDQLIDIENLTVGGYASVIGSAAANVITINGTGYNDIGGGDGNDTINAGGGNDSINGGWGEDVVYAGDGDDVITDTEAMYTDADDVYDGGAGTDTLVHDLAWVSGVTFDLAAGWSTWSGNRDQLISIENLTVGGSATVIGSAVANVLTVNGTGANDISGGDGNDTIDAGGGNDSINAGTGQDLVVAGDGDDIITDTETMLASEDDVYDGGAGIDTLVHDLNWVSGVTFDLTSGWSTWGGNRDQLISIENLTVGGSATVIGSAVANVLTVNGVGSNLISGMAGNDTLNAGGGNDTLDGGDGDDYLDGGADTDTATYQNAAAAVAVNLALAGAQNTGGAGTDTLVNIENLTGSAFADTLQGNAGNNMFDGGAGNDTIKAWDGNDSLDGGAGVDSLAGGLGNDVYYVDSDLDYVREYAGEGTDVVYSTAATYQIVLNNVENLYLVGVGNQNGKGNSSNNLIVGQAGDNVLDGLYGDDTLIGGDGNDLLNGGLGLDSMVGGLGDDVYWVNGPSEFVVELAGEGTDTVYSTAGTYTLTDNVEILRNMLTTGTQTGKGNALDNTLLGNTGNDNLQGLDGNDTLTGNDGNDTLNGGNGNDSLNGSAGDDSMLGGAGNDTLNGGNGNDSLYGNAGDDSLVGSTGNDTMDGGTGIDTMSGLQGDDNYVVTAGDVVTEFAGNGYDRVFASVDYTLTNNVEYLELTGTAVNGTGNSLDNTLVGNGSANTLAGLGGADTLDGKGGNDALYAGVDAVVDQFVFSTALNAATNVDTLYQADFGEDQILLSTGIFGALGGVGILGAGYYFEGAGYTGGGATDAAGIWYDLTSGSLYYNPTSGVAGDSVKFAIVDGASASLANSDFTLFA